jgi:hypothetical protein
MRSKRLAPVATAGAAPGHPGDLRGKLFAGMAHM